MKRVTPGLAAAWFAAVAALAHADESSFRLRDAPGSEVTTAHCAMCHSLDYIEMNAPVFDKTGWEKSVRKMITTFGAPITEENARLIADYLGKNY